MRPIDADKIRDRVNERYKCCNPGSIVEACLGAMLDIIDTEPTVTLPPNAPLTLEELREMDKEWVWISDLDKTPPSIARHAQLVYHTERGFRTRKFYLSAEAYGKTWLAYRRKPEEGA